MTSQPPPPNVAAQAANQAGMMALRDRDFAAAARLFAQATEADPGAGPLWLNLASAHRALGDDRAEMAALDRALDLNRTDFIAWLRKAQLHQRLGQDADAFQAWHGVLQLAQHISSLSEQTIAELQAGMAYRDAQQQRLSDAVDQGIAARLDGADATTRRRGQAFVDRALGRRAIYHNDCSGLYYPFLPADEFFDDAHFPWFAELERHTDAIRAELLGLLADGTSALRPYVSMEKGVPQNKWSTLDHKLDWGACFLWEYGKPNQPVLDRCPVTASALQSVPRAQINGRSPSAFFSLLQPHTHIPPHTGVTNTRAIIHLPLIVPDGCWFRVGAETRPWVQGKAFAFDDTIDHEAMNPTDQMRAILIFDVWNPHLSAAEQDLIRDYYHLADTTGLAPALPSI